MVTTARHGLARVQPVRRPGPSHPRPDVRCIRSRLPRRPGVWLDSRTESRGLLATSGPVVADTFGFVIAKMWDVPDSGYADVLPVITVHPGARQVAWRQTLPRRFAAGFRCLPSGAYPSPTGNLNPTSPVSLWRWTLRWIGELAIDAPGGHLCACGNL